MKRIIIRSSAILALVLISIVLFYAGKEHSILLDNKNITIDGNEYKALKLAEVQIDSEDSIEVYKRDRLKIDTSSQNHKIRITFMENGIEREILKKFKLNVNVPMYMISIPALVADDAKWIEIFEIKE